MEAAATDEFENGAADDQAGFPPEQSRGMDHRAARRQQQVAM